MLLFQVCWSKSCQMVAAGQGELWVWPQVEPLQRGRLGDRGQMVVTLSEPNFKSSNASFKIWMPLVIAASTKTTFTPSLYQRLNTGYRDVCFLSREVKKKKYWCAWIAPLLCLVLLCIESTIHLFFKHPWLIWPVSSDVVLLPWLPSAPVCTMVLPVQNSSHRHHRPRPLPLHMTETPFAGDGSRVYWSKSSRTAAILIMVNIHFTTFIWKQPSDSKLINYSWMPSETHHGTGITSTAAWSLLHKPMALTLFLWNSQCTDDCLFHFFSEQAI